MIQEISEQNKEEEEEKVDLLIEQLSITSKRYFAPHTSKIESQCTPCIMCQKSSKYVCPKCKQYYCGLPCYKSHSEKCTEQFYKENCEQYLKTQKTDRKSQAQLAKIIEREKEHEKNEFDEISIKQRERWEELHERIQCEDLTINDLSQDEQRDFFKFIDSVNQVKQWIPWWEQPNFPSLYVTVQNESNKNKIYLKRIKIQQRFLKIPKINIIELGQTSPELPFHILSTIYGMEVLFRLYNGDVFSEILESSQVLYNMCPCLSVSKMMNLVSVQTTLQFCQQNLVNQNFIDYQSLKIISIKDLLNIYSEIFYVVESLFKIYDMLHHYEQEIQSQIDKIEQDQDGAKLEKEIKKISGIKNKIIFFISFVKKQRAEQIKLIQDQIRAYVNENDGFQDQVEQLQKAKKLNLIL